MGAEMGVGPSRSFWIEVVDDRNEGGEFNGISWSCPRYSWTDNHCILQHSLMAIVSSQWLFVKERSHATQLLSTGIVLAYFLSMSSRDTNWAYMLLHSSVPLSCPCFMHDGQNCRFLQFSSVLVAPAREHGLWTIFRKLFSNNLPVVDKRLIGRKYCRNFGSLPGFSNIITFASFQNFGKWDSRRQWLNKCVRCTSDFLGRCLRHSFGIPSSPQDFLNFSEFAKFHTPHDVQ
jgi:hypothetical protein